LFKEEVKTKGRKNTTAEIQYLLKHMQQNQDNLLALARNHKE
jgi:hypothetical protein